MHKTIFTVYITDLDIGLLFVLLWYAALAAGAYCVWRRSRPHLTQRSA